MQPDEQLAAEALNGLQQQQPFFQRVQSIPIVNNCVNQLSTAYQTTKNASGVIKYSAENLEHSIAYISKPVLSTLEPVLKPLDRFASNQLDKVEKTFPSLRPLDRSDDEQLPPLQQDRVSRELPPLKLNLLQPPSVPLPGLSSPYADSRLESPRSPAPLDHPTAQATSSRWAISKLGDDTIRALRYCLDFLKYAIDNVSHQMTVLRRALADAGSGVVSILTLKQNPDGTVATTSGNVLALISKVKREIVESLRRVVELLGRYSSSYLPFDARQAVRSFILSLPSRMSSLKNNPPPAQPIELNQSIIEQESAKVLQLGNESLSMLENIHQVISTSVSAAEYTLGKREETVDLNGTPSRRVNTPSDHVDMEGDVEMEQI